MDKNKIIEQFWNSKEVDEAFGKMHPKELQYDLKAEVFLVLCEMDEEKLIGLYQRCELKFYIVRTMLNMIKSDRSAFFKNYRNFNDYTDTGKQTEPESSDLLDRMESKLEGLHWYHKEILKLYAIDFKKNAKELSRKTGIPYMSIIRTLSKTKKELKLKLKK